MLTEIKIIYLGDLYRFYIDESGEVALAYLFPMMGTNAQELEVDEIPRDVLKELELKMS